MGIEIKLDAYRCIDLKHCREVTLFSRHQKVLSKRFSGARIAQSDFVVDGRTCGLGSARKTIMSIHINSGGQAPSIIVTPLMCYTEMESFS
jgi:ATP-dependent DNA ligase